MSESLRIYEVHAECCPLNDTSLNCLDCEHCVSVDGRWVECEYNEEAEEAYMFYGLVGEVGEFASKIAKAIRRGVLGFEGDNDFYTRIPAEAEQSEFMEGLMGEVGDCLWFLAGIAGKLGMTLEDVARYNLDKLASRKERGKIEGEGDKR